jgi:anti-anti-sigma regulatory factor
MIISKSGNTTIITQETFTIVELVKKLEALYPKYKNDNIIIVLTGLEAINANHVSEFLQLSKMHKNAKHSFVIVSEKLNIEDVSSALTVVPTQQEAHDIIEMEEIERDLGF